MKKLISAALALAMAAMCFVGCGSSASSAPASSEAGSQAASAEGAGVPAEDIKVGVIHIGDPAAGSGYSYAHDQGIVAMQQTLGLSDSQIIRKNNISDSDTTAIENAMMECIEEGCNIIFATSWGYMDTCEKRSEERV